MSTVRAAVLPAPRAPIEIRELPEPPLEEGGSIVAVELSEVCGTDVHLAAGRLQGVPYPIVPGHVAAGRLAKIRGRLLDIEGRPFKEGDLVTWLDVHGTCNACWYCLVAKATTRCPQRRVYGITFGTVDGPSGGWAEAIHLKPGTRCLRLKGVDAATFMAGGCALPTAIHAIERAGVRVGDSVVVLGTGPVGLAATIVAGMQGADPILSIGAPVDRLRAAVKAGATAALDFESHDGAARAEWVRKRTGGRGADVVIEATGAPDAVVQAMRCARDNGRVVVVGQYTDAGDTAFNPHADLNRKHLDVRGCWGSDYSHFDRAVRLMANPARAARFTEIPSRLYPLEHAGEALADVAARRVIKAIIDPLVRRPGACSRQVASS